MPQMETGILLLHGFNGSRKEVEPLRQRLEQEGYLVAVPRLAGHEGSKRDLA